MGYKRLYYFFNCLHCGEIYYSSKQIKTKKCIKCRKTFKLSHSTLIKVELDQSQAIALLKRLKVEKANQRKGTLIQLFRKLNSQDRPGKSQRMQVGFSYFKTEDFCSFEAFSLSVIQEVHVHRGFPFGG